jgi:hypothetical protein
LEVRDEYDESAPARATQAIGPRGEVGGSRTGGRGDECAEEECEVTGAAGWGEFELDTVRDEHEARDVLILDCGRSEECGRLCRAVRLAPAWRSEAHTGRHIEHQSQLESALLDIASDVGTSLPGRDVPVEMANVVARFIRSELRKREPCPRP